jgi:hypothetical protein
MVAYSFKRQFIEPILDGRKGGTIRASRKHGHARPGEELQLYFGMRTRQCRLITRHKCASTKPIYLCFGRAGLIAFPQVTSSPEVLTDSYSLNQFARFDGFTDFAEMASFWEAQGAREFSGWHICWLPWRPERG